MKKIYSVLVENRSGVLCKVAAVSYTHLKKVLQCESTERLFVFSVSILHGAFRRLFRSRGSVLTAFGAGITRLRSPFSGILFKARRIVFRSNNYGIIRRHLSLQNL